MTPCLLPEVTISMPAALESLSIKLPRASSLGEMVAVELKHLSNSICRLYPICLRMEGKVCPYHRAPKEIRIRVVSSPPIIQDQYLRYQTSSHRLRPKYRFFDTNRLQTAASDQLAQQEALHELPAKAPCRFTRCSPTTRRCRPQLLLPTWGRSNEALLFLVLEQRHPARQTLHHLRDHLFVMV
jgi:hypothetical protein